MRQSYLKNAALMTGADVLLRLAGMGLRIWLANALGGEGMGLYQLVLAVYSLFVTLATAGVSVAATRLMAEELARSPAEARGMLHRLLLAGLAAKWWLGDVRAAGALRVSSLGLPWMAVSSVLRGFFIARRQVEPNVLSQLAEQTVRIGIVYFALERADVLGWDILWPVEGGRCLASALHTAENMLVPACLAVYLQFSGGRAEAVAQYGNLKGMALPLLTFPFGLLGSLSVLLMPEITQAHLRGQSGRLAALIDRMLRLTGYFSALAGAAFWVWGQPLAEALYGSAEAGSYLVILGPAMPLMYLESMVDGAMKGVGEQKAVFRYSMWDSCLRIAGVLLLLPRFGMKGFLFVILLSSFYTCTANTGRLLSSCGLRLQLWRWLGAPGFAGAVSAGAGLALRHLLADWLTGGAPLQLAAVALGGAGMAAVCFAAAWPLGLGEELRAVAAGERRHKKNVQKVK